MTHDGSVTVAGLSGKRHQLAGGDCSRSVDTTVVSSVASRLLSLPADRRAPAAARDVVREVLLAAHLDELLDDALLLATELTTNAVLHMGADITVLVEASDESVTVTIRDTGPDELPQLNESVALRYPLASTGRGLLLVDKIAYRWGTTQDARTKAVWFQLAKAGGLQETAVAEKSWHGAGTAGFIAWCRRRRRQHQSLAAKGVAADGVAAKGLVVEE